MVISVKTEQQLMEEISIIKRPGLAEFLSRVSSMFEVIIYTSGLRQLSEPLIGVLDDKKVVAYSLFREHCEKIDGKIVKDLRKLNRDLKNLILMKSSANNSTLQPENCISIKPFMGDKSDKELHKIMGLLDFLRYVMDVRPCRIWEKQYSENQKLIKNNTHIRGPSLSVLKEMPTLEDKIDSPGVVFQSSLKPKPLLQNNKGEIERIDSIYTLDKVGKFKFDEMDLAKAELETEANSNALGTPINGLELPVNAREDIEFVLRRPSLKKKKLTVMIKQMNSMLGRPSPTAIEFNEIELSGKHMNSSKRQDKSSLLKSSDANKFVSESIDE